MTAPALLLLAACALAAPLHAASLPAEGRNSPALPGPADIPVQVLLENVEPSVKLNEVDGDEALRPPIDLRNPGLPQRQEHETQNPDQHPDDQLRVSSIKQTIKRTKNLLRKSIQGVSENIQTWFFKNDEQKQIENNIQNLRNTFTNQIQKLDESIQKLAEPASEPSARDSLKNYAAIETQLKALKDKFNTDMEILTSGVELVSSLRSGVYEGDAKEEEAPTPIPPAPAPVPANPDNTATTTSPGVIAQTMNNIFTGISTSFQNLQNLLTPPAQSQPPAEAQADTPAGSTARPPWSLPAFNFTNPLSQLQGSFTNFTQNFQPPNSWFNVSFPTLQPIENILPSIQNILPPILRTTTAKSVEAANNPAAADKPVAVPEAAVDQLAADKPAVDKLAVDKPAVDEPSVEKPTADKPAADKPEGDKPVTDKPAVDVSTTIKPTTAPEQSKPQHVLPEPNRQFFLDLLGRIWWWSLYRQNMGI